MHGELRVESMFRPVEKTLLALTAHHCSDCDEDQTLGYTICHKMVEEEMVTLLVPFEIQLPV